MKSNSQNQTGESTSGENNKLVPVRSRKRISMHATPNTGILKEIPF